MDIRRGIIRKFDSGTYLADVQIVGSMATMLTGVPVAKQIGADLLTSGTKCGVLFFDETNPSDACVVFVYEGAPVPWVTSALIKDGEVAVGDLAFDPVTSPSFGQLKHLSVHVTGNGTRYKDYTWDHGMGAAPLGVVATIDMTGVGGWWGVNTYNPSATSVKFRVFSIDGGNWSNTLNLRALGIWA